MRKRAVQEERGSSLWALTSITFRHAHCGDYRKLNPQIKQLNMVPMLSTFSKSYHILLCGIRDIIFTIFRFLAQQLPNCS